MRKYARRANWLSIIPALTWVVAASGQTRAESQPAVDPAVDQILTRLEQREVHDLHAELAHHQHFVLDEEVDDVTKRGSIWYQQHAPVSRFRVDFDTKISGRGRKDKLEEQHLFDGQWYVERQGRSKTVVRREVRKPDDPSDPYKLGEGLFPLPFGQKKADILREFEVTLIPPVAGDPPNTDHLQLVPRPETGSGRQYKELHFWVVQDGELGGLPVRVKVAKKDNTGKVNAYITITFGKVELNQGVPDDRFVIVTPGGYHEEIEPLERAAPAPGAGNLPKNPPPSNGGAGGG